MELLELDEQEHELEELQPANAYIAELEIQFESMNQQMEVDYSYEQNDKDLIEGAYRNIEALFADQPGLDFLFCNLTNARTFLIYSI